MRKRTRAVRRGILLAFAFVAAAALPAQSSGGIDGVRWYNAWLGWELVVRENRFNLTDHSVQATFRGTFQTDGQYVQASIDARTTVFLEGPSGDQQKLDYIQELVAATRLPGFYAASPCSQQSEPEFSLQAVVSTTRLDLVYLCGATQVGRYTFLKVESAP